MGKLLELIDFHYYYGSIYSVKGINLYVDEGEMVAIIGANGAGKTTTMRSISGLTKRRGIHGKIIYQGKEIHNYLGAKVARMGISHALEGRRIFSKLTVEENLKMGAYLRKDTKGIQDDLNDIYRRFPRLLERKKQMGGTLSGGEQQMLAMGRAMMGSPKLLLLDEPSLGLAPLITKEIFVAINDINREGTTVLFVEQNSKIALATATRGYVMQTGEIVVSDTCQNLIDNEEVQKSYLGL